MNKMGINTIVNNCLFNLKEQYHDSDGDIVGYKILYLTHRDSQEIRDAVAEELVRRGYLDRTWSPVGRNAITGHFYMAKIIVGAYEYWQITGEWLYPESQDLKPKETRVDFNSHRKRF